MCPELFLCSKKAQDLQKEDVIPAGVKEQALSVPGFVTFRLVSKSLVLKGNSLIFLMNHLHVESGKTNLSASHQPQANDRRDRSFPA